MGCDKIQSKINEFSYSQDNKLSYSEFCVMMNKRRTSEKDGEQAEDRERYFEDLKLLLSVECDAAVREAAEARIKLHCLNCGVMICHGDYLTFERFESCKRLRQGSSSSFERFEYMELFRIGMFHLRMNKTIQVGIGSEILPRVLWK